MWYSIFWMFVGILWSIVCFRVWLDTVRIYQSFDIQQALGGILPNQMLWPIIYGRSINLVSWFCRQVPKTTTRFLLVDQSGVVARFEFRSLFEISCLRIWSFRSRMLIRSFRCSSYPVWVIYQIFLFPWISKVALRIFCSSHIPHSSRVWVSSHRSTNMISVALLG